MDAGNWFHKVRVQGNKSVFVCFCSTKRDQEMVGVSCRGLGGLVTIGGSGTATMHIRILKNMVKRAFLLRSSKMMQHVTDRALVVESS